jgi:hypothetical protein
MYRSCCFVSRAASDATIAVAVRPLVIVCTLDHLHKLHAESKLINLKAMA